MRALQYEGTPSENAQSFKEQGNEIVKAKRWKDGQEFYSKALLILQKSRLDRKGKTPEDADEELEVLKEAQLEETCLVNRALCNLELSTSSLFLDCNTKEEGLTFYRKLPIHDSRLCVCSPHQSKEC